MKTAYMAHATHRYLLDVENLMGQIKFSQGSDLFGPGGGEAKPMIPIYDEFFEEEEQEESTDPVYRTYSLWED
ncbi:MAG: hypothetical protein IJV55_01065 [Paludibacteraceae bacterium]|nr:hypothetical protein [Paludibacteraceae bacterium]